MDQRRFLVIREERCNVVVQKHTIRQQRQEDPVKLIMRSDEFPELYHLDMPTHQQEDHYHHMKDYDTSYGGGGCGWTILKPAGKQCSAPPPHHQVQACQRPPVEAQVQKCYVVPPQGQTQKVDYYPAIHHYYQPTQPPPLMKKPAPAGNIIDSNEAAKLYGGILIKEFGRSKLPVRV